MKTQRETDLSMDEYLDGLGIHPIAVAIAVSDKYLKKTCRLLKKNPQITKEEFLRKMKLDEEQYRRRRDWPLPENDMP